MNTQDYRNKLTEISKRHWKKAPGAKYIHKWDLYMLEKQFCVDNMNFDGVNSVLEIGCGLPPGKIVGLTWAPARNQ